MRIRLTPERREFFDLFSRASSNAVDIARLLVELLDRFPQDGDGAAGERIKEHEQPGDELTHEVVTLINRTFVTPFDRDDIYRLATAIDDVCDFVDESAGQPRTRTASTEVPQLARGPGGRDPARDDPARRGDAAARGLQGLQAAS